MHHFFIFVTALFMSVVMVPPIRRWALDAGAVDRPGGRKIHAGEIPRLGGVAIFLPFLFSILVYFDPGKEVRGILAGSLIIFFTGLADDLSPLSPLRKLVGQVSGCIVAVTVGHIYIYRLGDLFGTGPIDLPTWISLPFTVFALVGVINAFNLIDGLDGLAGGVGVISLGAFFLLGLQERNFAVLALCSGLLGGMIGFLKYNAFPARIFMGDAGSLVVGFVIGSVAIVLTQTANAHIHPVVSLLILALPITDTIVVMFQRIIKGQNPLAADRTHLHHKILEIGVDHAMAVLLIYLISLGWILFALFFQKSQEYILFAFFIFGTIVLNVIVRCFYSNRGSVGEKFHLLNDKISSVWLSKSFIKFEKNLDSIIVLFVLMFGFLSFFNESSYSSIVYLFFLSSSLMFVVLSMIFKFEYRWISLSSLILCGSLICFYIENLSINSKVFGFSVGFLSNQIFVVLALLLSIKFLFLKTFDKLLKNPIAFVVLAMSISLAVVSPEFDLKYHISGVLSKSIVLFLSFKCIVESTKMKLLSMSIGIFFIGVFIILNFSQGTG